MRTPSAALRSILSTPARMTPTGSASKESLVDLETTFQSSSKFDRTLNEGTRLISHSLWNNQEAINSINQTYEIDTDVDAWNYRSHLLLSELQDQVRLYACSVGVWTQTVDVEGEVNGLMTYDRRVKRVNETQWKDDIQGLYDAASKRTNSSSTN